MACVSRVRKPSVNMEEHPIVNNIILRAMFFEDIVAEEIIDLTKVDPPILSAHVSRIGCSKEEARSMIVGKPIRQTLTNSLNVMHFVIDERSEYRDHQGFYIELLDVKGHVHMCYYIPGSEAVKDTHFEDNGMHWKQRMVWKAVYSLPEAYEALERAMNKQIVCDRTREFPAPAKTYH